MPETYEIRASTPDDLPQIEALYPAAFPEEDLLPLIAHLLNGKTEVLSLVALAGGKIAGHIALTACGITGLPDKVALLGPLAVDPHAQRQGIGSALVAAGLERAARDGMTRVFVLGDPAYYGRLGFVADAEVLPPYPLPAEWRTAWQSQSLSGGARRHAGQLLVPAPWHHPALWSD